MLAIHGDDDGVPDLGNEDFGLVLDLHVGCSQQFSVNALGETRVNVFPRCPNGETQGERAGDGHAAGCVSMLLARHPE